MVPCSWQHGGPITLASDKALATELESLVAKLPEPSDPVQETARKPIRRTIRQATANELADMVASYEAGATVGELVVQHGLGRNAVSTALKQAGVTLRRQGLTSEQLDEAARLYVYGLSLARVAERFGVNATTVRSRLLQCGVVMRPASWRA